MPKMKDLPDSTAAENLYLDRVVVYVEGDSDVNILERMFPEYKNSDLLFKRPATPENPELGGCLAVIERVKTEAGASSLPVWGLLDRDVFHRRRDWEHFYADDDDRVIRAKRFGDHIVPLMRWEMEGYVVEPAMTERLRCNVGRHRGASERALDEVRADIITHCRCLLPVSAANGFLHERGSQQLGKAQKDLDWIKSITTPEDMLAAVKKRVSAISTSAAGTGMSLEDHYQRVLDMAPADGDNSPEALQRILRVTDSKLLLIRLFCCYGINDDHTYLLADRLGSVPLEERNSDLVRFIRSAVAGWNARRSGLPHGDTTVGPS